MNRNLSRHTDPITMAELRLHVPDAAQPRRIGWLSQVGDNIRVSFDDAYVGDAARPTLSQLYRGADEAQTRAILAAVNDERLVRIGRLPVFFENMLPEGHNRDRLAERRGVERDDEFELLAAAGHDLPGALEVLPAHEVPTGVVELHATRRLEPLEPSAVAAPVEDGFSLGGFVTKFSMVHRGARYVVRSGTEAGEVLVKLPSTAYPDLVHNEACCYRLAEAVGVRTAGASARPMAELNLPGVELPFSHYLHVPRFDRRRLLDGRTQRVHFEELTQALGIDSRRKYRDLPAAMRALLVLLKQSPASDVRELDEVFRRWTAYALMGNTDAHSKNWALLYEDGVHPRLAPAYDMVCVAAYFDPADPRALSQNRKMDESLRAWNEDAAAALAKAAGLLAFNRFRRIVRDTRERARALWPAMLADAPERVAHTITQRLT